MHAEIVHAVSRHNQLQNWSINFCTQYTIQFISIVQKSRNKNCSQIHKLLFNYFYHYYLIIDKSAPMKFNEYSIKYFFFYVRHSLICRSYGERLNEGIREKKKGSIYKYRQTSICTNVITRSQRPSLRRSLYKRTKKSVPYNTGTAPPPRHPHTHPPPPHSRTQFSYATLYIEHTLHE